LEIRLQVRAQFSIIQIQYPESPNGLTLKKGEKAMLFAPKEKGQGLVEYALILVLVAIVVIAVLMLLGPIIGGVFSTINDSLSSVS
jgi:pilus assembly protein Flp/PilA